MSTKQAVVNIVYPKEAASDFNMDYYLSTHMPLVAKLWGPSGLKSWSVVTLNPESGYHVQAILVWESVEAYEKALEGAASSEIFGDIEKFTSTSPVKWAGPLEGHSTTG